MGGSLNDRPCCKRLRPTELTCARLGSAGCDPFHGVSTEHLLARVTATVADARSPAPRITGTIPGLSLMLSAITEQRGTGGQDADADGGSQAVLARDRFEQFQHMIVPALRCSIYDYPRAKCRRPKIFLLRLLGALDR